MDNEITKDQLTQISDYLQGTCDTDFREDDELGIFRTYSGRGMYGKYCLGLVIAGSDVFEVAMNLAEALIRADADYELVEAFKHVSTDSMGHDTVYYWKNIAVVDEADDGEADEEELADDAEKPASERQYQ